MEDQDVRDGKVCRLPRYSEDLPACRTADKHIQTHGLQSKTLEVLGLTTTPSSRCARDKHSWSLPSQGLKAFRKIHCSLSTDVHRTGRPGTFGYTYVVRVDKRLPTPAPATTSWRPFATNRKDWPTAHISEALLITDSRLAGVAVAP